MGNIPADWEPKPSAFILYRAANLFWMGVAGFGLWWIAQAMINTEKWWIFAACLIPGWFAIGVTFSAFMRVIRGPLPYWAALAKADRERERQAALAEEHRNAP